MRIEEIENELSEIIDFAGCYYNKDNSEEINERITNLNVYLARSAVLLSEAQYLYDRKYADETEALLSEQQLSPSVITNLAKSRCALEGKIVKLAERINRTITHQLDSLRTQLSYLKVLQMEK
ncbi:MAG: hypothetical protein QXD05_00030 [Candidatus Pacearchaeota archaeon]